MTTATGSRLEGDRREALRRRLQVLGFDEVRFAEVERGVNSSLRGWLDAGHHADMHWLERTAEKRMKADLVLPGVRSIIMLGVNYWVDPSIKNQKPKIKNVRWARYALHEDYHDTLKPGLIAAGRVLEETCAITSADYRYYADTGPVLERGWAARAGLGFLGKNAMLISRAHGNWLFLATILTRAEIAPDEPLRPGAPRVDGGEPAGLLCGKCTRCLDACPTDAFPRPGVVDSRRCISYQTIENKGVIPRELRAGIGAHLYGCDICLEVCPWNRFAQDGRRFLLAARDDIAEISLREILELTPARFAEIFRGTAIKRLKLTGLLRNACVVAGNSGDATLVPILVQLAAHDAVVVRAHAVWAALQIAGSGAAGLLHSARENEKDGMVLAEYETMRQGGLSSIRRSSKPENSKQCDKDNFNAETRVRQVRRPLSSP